MVKEQKLLPVDFLLLFLFVLCGGQQQSTWALWIYFISEEILTACTISVEIPSPKVGKNTCASLQHLFGQRLSHFAVKMSLSEEPVQVQHCNAALQSIHIHTTLFICIHRCIPAIYTILPKCAKKVWIQNSKACRTEWSPFFLALQITMGRAKWNGTTFCNNSNMKWWDSEQRFSKNIKQILSFRSFIQ